MASTFDLRRFALTYKRQLDLTQKGPANWAEAIKTAKQLDCAESLERLSKSGLNVAWGQSTAEVTIGAANFILAYERNVNLRGGPVALMDGSVKNLPLDEMMKMLEAQKQFGIPK